MAMAGGMILDMRLQPQDTQKSVWMSPLSHVSSFFHSFSDVFRQTPFSLLFCSLTGLLAGIGLSLMTDMLQLLPGLMILIPPAIAMRGNIYSALVSRLGTSMHLGLFSPTLKKGSVLHLNAYASLLLTLFLSVVLGFLAKLVAETYGVLGTNYITLSGFILISVIGGLISGFILLGISILVSITGYRRNWDLDNMSSPIITSAGDMITIPSLFFAAVLLLKLNSYNAKIMGFLSSVTLLAVLVVFVAIICTVKGLKSNNAELRRILFESIPMLLVCGILCTFAGITLDMELENLITAILVLIPPFLGACNALGGILSARLSSMLHIGTLIPKQFPDKLVAANFTVIYLLSVAVFSFVGLITYFATAPTGTVFPGALEQLAKMLAIALLGGVLCTTFLNFASYYIAILSFKFGLDPDNDTIPLITSLTDVVGVLCLLFAMQIIL